MEIKKCLRGISSNAICGPWLGLDSKEKEKNGGITRVKHTD